MGCPDWPKCFGLLAPPTCECQLPPNYQDIFLNKRIAKVNKFAALLDKTGFHKQAQLLRADKRILQPELFNVNKAWIEYINRLFGVLSGLFSLAFVTIGFFTPQSRKVRLAAGFGLLMLVLNAWLGSVVVATNLLPGIVSVHFMLSFLCIFGFMLAIHGSTPFQYHFSGTKHVKVWWLLFGLLMAEVFMGALARENVESLLEANKLVASNGQLAYKSMNPLFGFHRFLPAVIFIIAAAFAWINRSKATGESRAFLVVACMGLLQISLGALNIVFVLPPASQVLHIVLGSILPVLCFYFLIAKGTAEKS